MEQVIRTYGSFLLGAVALGSIVWLLFQGMTDGEGHDGIFAMVGAWQEDEQSIAGVDFAGFQTESEKEDPTLRYVWSGMLYTGEYTLEQLVTAEDYRGNRLAVVLCGVCDPEGRSWERENLEGDSIRLERPGVYRLTVRAVDAWNRSTVCEICVPVNGGVV